MNWAAWAILIVAAVVTAALSGVVGMAGGIALLGVMAAVMPAAAVVPVHGVVQLCSNFTRTLTLLKRIRWRIFATYTLPAALGAAGAWLVGAQAHLPWFKPAVGAFIILFLISRHTLPKLRNLPLWSFAPLGLVTGFLSIFIGATGPLIAPFFLRDDLEPEEVVGTKAAVQSVTHLAKIPVFLAADFDYLAHKELLAVLIACVIVGTLIGRTVLAKLPKKAFDVVFQVVLTGVAVYLLGSLVL